MISSSDGATYVRYYSTLHTYWEAAEDLEKNQKDSLRRKSKNFLEKSGLLYFRDEKKSVDLHVSVCNGFFSLAYTSFCLIRCISLTLPT